MNILFVNYGDFTTNSLNHIGIFANALCAAGHSAVVAVPHGKETISHVAAPLFIPATFEQVLATRDIFPNGQPANIIHAWTPREAVRKFAIAYQRTLATPARLIVHLEDSERFLLEAYTGKSFETLRADSFATTAEWLVDALSHPIRHESFLAVADGISHIVDRLKEFAPRDVPTQLLPPGVDFSFYAPQPADPKLRAELGLRDGERVIVFTGSNTFANEPEMRELYLAIALLNQRNRPTRLIRTGFNSPKFLDGLADSVKRHVLDLGFVEKAKLPKLLALADVLVQPGRAGPFNDFRLPSKLPEFLAMGKPVVLPATNVGLLLEEDRDAVLLRTGTPSEIADACERLFDDPQLCATLGANGATFARRHFDPAANTRALTDFYTAARARAPVSDWSLVKQAPRSETTILAARLCDQVITGTASAPQAELLRDLILQMEESSEARVVALRAARDHAIEQHTLTQQHARNLDEFLSTTRTHVAALEKIRDGLNGQIENERQQNAALLESLHRELATAQTSRARAEETLTSARAELAAAGENLSRTQAALAEREREAKANKALLRQAELKHQQVEAHLRRTEAKLAEHQSELAHIQAVLRSREAKIGNMQASFSWQITSPLRAVRRALLDRPPLPRVSQYLLGNIDSPDWSFIPESLPVRGWTLHKHRSPLKAIRVRLGRRDIPVRFGLPRPDLPAHFPEHPQAANCGWSAQVRVPQSGVHPLVIEAQDDSGTWHVIAAREIRRTAELPPAPPGSYAAWVHAHDTLTADDAARLRQNLSALNTRPLISILVPTYNTPAEWLVRAIASVREQIYDRWELCIADDASTQPQVRKIIERERKQDPRIKVVYRDANGHISAASNSALALAQGEFVALLDHDDELRPHALAEVALALAANPALEFLYSDEDKLDELGRRCEPYFKPDWNPDLLLGQNYTCHLSVFRTQRLRELGGFRIGCEGSQDWDLTLRFTEGLAPERIHHIPRVLYHWRASPGSTALQIDQKDSYPFLAAKKALADHLDRTGVSAELVPVEGRHWRVRRALPSPAPKVSIIVPTRNAEALLRVSVGSLREKTTYSDFELIVVDNRSDDPGTLAYFAELRAAGVRILPYDAPFNFSALNNFAAREARGSVLAFLNNDIEVITPDWLEEMVSQAVRPEIGAVGAMLYYPDDTVQHAGAVLGITGPALRDGVAGHAFKRYPRGADGQCNRLRLVQNYSAVTAACLVIRRELFEQVGGFNERDLAVAFNDIDFCLRVRESGHRNLWTPFAEFYHHESASRGSEDSPEKIARFQREVAYMRRTWAPLLDRDPAYNPNLTLISEDFSFSFPPR